MPPENEGNAPEPNNDGQQDQGNRDQGQEPGGGPNPYKAKYEQVQAELDKLKRAQMTRSEQLEADSASARKRAEEAEAKLEQLALQNAFTAEALKAGCRDPEAAFALADRSVLRYEDGKAVGVTKALKALQESKAYLFATQGSRLGSGGGNPGKSSEAGDTNQRINEFIRRRAGR